MKKKHASVFDGLPNVDGQLTTFVLQKLSHTSPHPRLVGTDDVIGSAEAAIDLSCPRLNIESDQTFSGNVFHRTDDA